MTQTNDVSFGYINLESKTFREGRVVDGKMYYAAEGTPTEIPEGMVEKQKVVSPDIITTEGYVTATRWAGVRRYLKKLSFEYGLTIDLQEDKGWFNTTVDFKVTGEREAVTKFCDQLNKDIEAYKNRIGF